jgi:hypothetical protein
MILCLTLPTAIGQKKEKAWTDWSRKEAQKVLDDSPWAKIQTDSDTSQMMFSPTSHSGTGVSNEQRDVNMDRAAAGATNQTVHITFHVRFYSARPVRQALARMVQLANPSIDVAKLQSFADLKATDSIIVTVTYDSNDQRYGNSVMQAFNSAITSTLKNNTYLQRSDNKQLFLEEYVPPGKDGFGARFIFLRNVEGKPFIDENAGEIRFYSQFPHGGTIDRRFKVADMTYQGQLEY